MSFRYTIIIRGLRGAGEVAMMRTKKLKALCCAAAITLLLAWCGGCGSSSSSKISQAQAQAISHEFVTAVESALSSAAPGDASLERSAQQNLSAVVGDIHPDQSSGCVTSASGTSCNIPVAYSGACPGGGTIGVSGAFDFTLNNSGDGSDSTTLTITPTNCSVSNLTINGDPNVTVATEINFTGNQVQFPIAATEAGEISYGPNPSGSCTIKVSLTLNSTSQTGCTVTGTVCGQSVSGSC